MVIAHRDTLVRSGIARIIREGGFRVVGEASTEEELHRAVGQHGPDIVLMDHQMPPDYLVVVGRLVADSPRTTVAILARPQSTPAFLPAIEGGARGYLSVDLSPEHFVDSLKAVAMGDIVVSGDMADAVLEQLSAGSGAVAQPELSEREQQVLALVGSGATNPEIAQDLVISPHTVKVHLRSIYTKLRLRNRQQAAAYAVREGLVGEFGLEEGADPQASQPSLMPHPDPFG